MKISTYVAIVNTYILLVGTRVLYLGVISPIITTKTSSPLF